MADEDQAFFDQMRECRGPYRVLGECFDLILKDMFLSTAHSEPRKSFDALNCRTCYDIGCGVGSQCERMAELGWSVVSVDTDLAKQNRIGENYTFTVADITKLHPEWEPRDVVISTETAEHLPEEFADPFVASLARLAKRTIIFSAAQPGQEWPGHVNLQSVSYWLIKFARLGWQLDGDRTKLLRTLMVQKSAQHMYCRENFMVLVPT